MSDKLTTNAQVLPTLQDLVGNMEVYQKADKLNFLLNQEPPKDWIKEHPYIRGHKYIPIDKVEYLLRRVFKEYKIEILREGTSFNGVYVCIRLHYKNITDGEWSFHDGIGAIHLQVQKGSSASDLAKINNGALSMAYPLAKTLAIKDAADMFGKLFGSDLNRKETLKASMSIQNDVIDHEKERIVALIDGIETQDDIDFVRGHVTEELLPLFKAKVVVVNKTLK